MSDSERMGFARNSKHIRNQIFIPKYYDPGIDIILSTLRSSHKLVSVASLEARGMIEVATGIEVGKLAYGTGEVAFIRSSDLADWELAGQPKQRVSESLYQRLRKRVDIEPEDLLLVRDGTYLVGTTVVITASDAHSLYAGGLYKIHCPRPELFDPYLLLALFNTPIVKRQMRSKQFTRDSIDTLGRRLFELVIPVPKSAGRRARIADVTRKVVEERVLLRDRAKSLAIGIEGVELDEEERDLARSVGI